MRICRRDLGRLAVAGLATRAFGLSGRPKLLVLVLLGQFRSEYLDSIRSQLAPGGFRKLLEKGTVYYNCMNRASTFPASSLATVATGAWPAQHGIVADRWYDRSTSTPVRAADQPLLATTLLAEIAANARTRVAVVAASRERAALFAAGVPARDEPHLFWINAEGRFTSNGQPPDWLVAFQSPNSAETVRDGKWQAVGAPADAPALRVLNWNPSRPAEYMALYRSSPFADAAVFDLAAEVRTRYGLGESNTFDVLCILPDATEQLGYETGARNPLMQQMALQLDRRLDTFLGALAKTPGESSVAFALTAAHGAPAAPEPALRPVMAVNGELVAQAIQNSLSDQHQAGVVKYVYPFLYLKLDRMRESEAEIVRQAAGRAVLGLEGIAGYYTAGGACSVRNAWEQRFANSFHPVRSGDVMLSYRPGFIEATAANRGISYGSLYNYDARVPLFLYGPPFRQGVYERTVETVDLAPTLARVAGVSPPSSSTGRVLTEALAE